MNKNLNDYIFRLEKVIPHNVCDDTVNELKEKTFTKHTYSTGVGNEFSFDNDLSVRYDSTLLTYFYLMQICYESLRNYHKFINFDWYDHWTGYTEIRFNKYDQGTEMKKHCDHIRSVFDGKVKGVPILTILGSLNDNYEGGQLILFDDDVIEFNKGDIVIFPSNFLYPHQVSSVTRGTRFSFVSWSY